MTDTGPFALLVLVVAAVGLVAILSNRLTTWGRVPPPALFLVGAAVVASLVPAVRASQGRTVERVVTVAVLLILFDGGMQIGWARFRAAAVPIGFVGVLGTFLTVAAGAVLARVAFGLAWYTSLLLATAVAPTDPAAVFSVLGRREVSGRAGTILKGEAGANDPVGIALMVSLIAAGGLGAGTFANVGGEFVLQMGVGAAVGIAGGRLLLWFMRRVSLPSEGLYPLRTLAGALALFGIATVAHGSGFLAVFVAGIVLGDERAPYGQEIHRFHSALASLSEIVAFVVLGLTVHTAELGKADVWVPGVVLGLALALVIRPLFVGPCLLPARLRANERAFVLFAGLKGAVPILLGTFLVTARVHDAQRLYGIIVVVVVISIVAQGTLVPTVAYRLGLPMRSIEPEPWAHGVRLREAPDGAHRLTVAEGSPADGRTIGHLAQLPDTAWISMVVRDGRLVPARGGTELRAGDVVVVILDDPQMVEELTAVFERPSAQ